MECLNSFMATADGEHVTIWSKAPCQGNTSGFWLEMVLSTLASKVKNELNCSKQMQRYYWHVMNLISSSQNILGKNSSNYEANNTCWLSYKDSCLLLKSSHFGGTRSSLINKFLLMLCKLNRKPPLIAEVWESGWHCLFFFFFSHCYQSEGMSECLCPSNPRWLL